MITDINSLVSGQGKTSTAVTSSTANLGALAKLSSELKLIDGLHPIQITSVKNAQTTTGNQQLIGVTRSDQQQYTLVNDKPSPNLQAGAKGTLNVAGNQVTLTIPNQRPAQTSTSTMQAAPATPPSSNTAPSNLNTAAPSSSASSANSSNSAANATQKHASSGTNSANNLINTTQSRANSAPYAPTQVTTQQAQTIAQVAIASRPIVLTVISSHVEASPSAPTDVSQSSTKAAPSNAPLGPTQAPKTQISSGPVGNTSPSTANIASSTTSAPVSTANAPATTTNAPASTANATPSTVNAPASTVNASSPTPPTASVTSTATNQMSTAQTVSQDVSQTTNRPTPTSVNNTQVFSAVVSDGNEQFTLNTQHPLKVGDKLTVVVDKQGQVQLYPAERNSPTATTLTEGLKQSLPKQISPQEFVSMIRQLNTLAQSSAALPEKVANALEQLVKQLPNLQSLTQSSDSIKQAIQNSGLFSENNLAQKANLTADLKLNLSRLEGANLETSKQASLTGVQASTSQQAINLVAGAIERITTNQVRHLIENAQQDGSILPLSIEIPIKDGISTSVVNLKIDKDAAEKDKDIEPHKRRWLVQLKFDFEETGRFEARASVQENKVGVLFAVEDANTEQMIRQRLDELRTSLRSKQVEIETLDCFRAKLDNKPNQYQEPTQRRLIDVRT